MVVKTKYIVSFICLLGYFTFGSVLIYIVADRAYCSSGYYSGNTIGKARIGSPDDSEDTILEPSIPIMINKGEDDSENKLTKIEDNEKSKDNEIKDAKKSGSLDTIIDDNGIIVEKPQERFSDRYCAGGLHGVFMMLATLLVGLAIMVYRLFPEFLTLYVKWSHMALHVLGLISMIIGLYFTSTQEYIADYDSFRFHAYSSWIVIIFYLIQLLVGILIYFALPLKISFRLFVAPFHDVIGIWLFVSLVACCMSGKRFTQADYSESNQLLFYVMSYATWIIPLVVIISPYFEWELVC